MNQSKNNKHGMGDAQPCKFCGKSTCPCGNGPCGSCGCGKCGCGKECKERQAK